MINDDLPPIVYISGGAFGDFINQLGIISENYYKTGRKGILYLWGDRFRYGPDFTFKDTYDVISTQKFIKEYKKHNNEPYDIDLTSWFIDSRHLLHHTHWYNIFKNAYNLEWGSHPWISVPIDTKWSDITLINVRQERFGTEVDYSKLANKGKLVFIAAEIGDYNYFKQVTHLDVEYYKPLSFTDLCIAINSCKLFVCGISAPLAIANALHKSCVICLINPKDTTNNFYLGIEKHLPGINFKI